MSVYPLSDLKDLPGEGESITIDIHYPAWIIDSQRVDIEVITERYFSTWLISVLARGREYATEDIGSDDYEDFLKAIDGLTERAPLNLLAEPSLYDDIIKPAFVLSEVSKGGHKTRKRIALTLTTILAGAASGFASSSVGPAVTFFSNPKPQKIVIDSSLVCTRHTARSFVRTIANHLKHTEELTSRDMPPRVQAAANDLVRQVATMPNGDCSIRVVAADESGKEIEVFELTQKEAAEKVRKMVRKNIHYSR